MAGETGSFRHDDEPTPLQVDFLNRLIDQHLNNTKFELAWYLDYDDEELLKIHVGRYSQCKYIDGAVQKADPDDPAPLTSRELFHRNDDETSVNIQLLCFGPDKVGSQIVIKARDDGFFSASPLSPKNTSDPIDRIAAELFNYGSDNDQFPEARVGDEIQKFVTALGEIDLSNPEREEKNKLLETAIAMRSLLISRPNSPDTRSSLDTGKTISDTLVTMVSTKGKRMALVSTTYSTAHHLVCIQKDPLLTGNLGPNVNGVVTLQSKDPAGTLDNNRDRFLYIMNGGRIILSNEWLQQGPDVDYTFSSLTETNLPQINHAAIKAADVGDLAYILRALQEPALE